MMARALSDRRHPRSGHQPDATDAERCQTTVVGAGDYLTMTQNLESYHNTVHMFVGGNTMPNPAISPNDPMFWLHHANVDRL
jgi:tyrosinase